MSRLIFINKNKYDIFVPTPNGAGRRVKVNEAVEGNYFVDIANTGVLQRYVGDPNTVNIICNYRLNSYLQASKAPVSAVPAPPVVDPATPLVPPSSDPVVPAPVPLPVEDVPVVSPLTPSEKDLHKMSLEELRLAAAAQGIDVGPDVKKKILIKLIDAKSRN